MFPENFELCIFFLTTHRYSLLCCYAHPETTLNRTCPKCPLALGHLLCWPTSGASFSEDGRSSETPGQARTLSPGSCVPWKMLSLKSPLRATCCLTLRDIGRAHNCSRRVQLQIEGRPGGQEACAPHSASAAIILILSTSFSSL